MYQPDSMVSRRVDVRQDANDRRAGMGPVIFLVPAALPGLVAAAWPARRAAGLDVLAAIASR